MIAKHEELIASAAKSNAQILGLQQLFFEQPAHAVANGYFVGASNRAGTEKPWQIGVFYGKRDFCNPRSMIVAQASRGKDELVVADLNLDEIQQVGTTWQFYRDCRPETDGAIVRAQASVTTQAAD